MNKIYLTTNGTTNNNILIETLPGILENVITQDMKLKKDKNGNDLIDIISFEKVKLKREDWIGAFSLEKIISRELINQLAGEMEVIVTYDSRNRIKLVAIDEIGTPIEIDKKDIVLNKYGERDLSLAYDDVFYNCYTLYYRKDYNSGHFLKCEFIKPEGTSLTLDEDICNGKWGSYSEICNQSFNKYGVRKELKIIANHIRDRATAVKYLKKVVEQKSFKKEVISFNSVMNKKMLSIELGDIITFNIPNNYLEDKKYITTELKLDLIKSMIKVKVLQIE